MLLWGIFLTHGPSALQMRYALSTFRCAVTDFGFGSSIASCADCIAALMHFAAGRPESSSPPINHAALLFPSMIFIPGWNHLWANLLQSTMESQAAWPQRLRRLRELAWFLKIRDYRVSWSRALRRAGLWREADEVAKHFEGSFVHWRWETFATVLAKICRLREVLLERFMPELFDKMEDGAYLSEVTAAVKDKEVFRLGGPGV